MAWPDWPWPSYFTTDLRHCRRQSSILRQTFWWCCANEAGTTLTGAVTSLLASRTLQKTNASSIYSPVCMTQPQPSSWIITSEALRYGTCSQGISQFYLHTHTFIRNRNELTIPAFAFLAVAGTHLPTRRDDDQDELAEVAGYVVRQLTYAKAVTHPTTNRAQCRATALIETNALPLH